MRKIIALGIMLLFLGMTISSSTGLYLEKQSIKPLSTGNILYVGGNGTGNYSKIQDAINDASNGDTVFVYDDSSPYYENVVVDKSITLMGEDKNTTIIDSSGSGDAVYISADSVTLSGFTIQNAGMGIRLRRCNGYTLSNNIITSNLLGISSAYCSDNTISENIVTNNENTAISLQDLENSTISGNIVTNNGGSGISIHSRSYSNLISDNIVVGNGEGISLSEASNNIVSSNTITSNSFEGIYLQFSSGNTISENDIEDTDYYGIFVMSSSDNNTIYHNNFKNNTQNAYDECNNSWDNIYSSCGNYWDNYSGTDNYWGLNQNIPGSDGVGDTPYDLPCEHAIDRYPLMKPYGPTILSLINKPSMFGISLGIQNIGNKTAFNVKWKIVIEGGFVIGRNSSGITKPLLPGEKVTIKTGIILGLGKILITIDVWADNAPLVSKSINGYLLIIFLLINPGGGT